MKRFLIAGAVGALLAATPLAASAMPFASNVGGSADTILVGGHGHGHGPSFGHSRGRHLGWTVDRHRGWSHSRHHYH
jgi:hypothetical protein